MILSKTEAELLMISTRKTLKLRSVLMPSSSWRVKWTRLLSSTRSGKSGSILSRSAACTGVSSKTWRRCRGRFRRIPQLFRDLPIQAQWRSRRPQPSQRRKKERRRRELLWISKLPSLNSSSQPPERR